MAGLPETMGTSLVQSRMVVNLSQQLLSEEPALAAQGATNLTRLLLSEGGIEVLLREPAGIVVRAPSSPRPAPSRWVHQRHPSCTREACHVDPSSLVTRHALTARSSPSPHTSPCAHSGHIPCRDLVSPSTDLAQLHARMSLHPHSPTTFLTTLSLTDFGRLGAELQAVSQLGVLMQIAATKGAQVRTTSPTTPFSTALTPPPPATLRRPNPNTDRALSSGSAVPEPDDVIRSS
jgi:hypothetical protein